MNLTDSKMLVLDNRTIEDDGSYMSTDSHKIGNIHIQDVDNDGNKDIVVANYIEYQENNGSFTEISYDNIDAISFMDLNETNKIMIGLNSFDKNLILYNNSSSREYIKSKTITTLVSNPNQTISISLDQKNVIIVGHEGYPLMTVMIQKDANGEFYKDQLFKPSNPDSIGYSSMKESLKKEDINNDGKKDIILFGSNGFEIFYTK